MNAVRNLSLSKIKPLYDKLVDWIAIMLVSVITVVTSYQVFSRFVLNYTPAWTEELARFLLIWLVFIGSVIAYRKGSHLSVDFFLSLLPPRIMRIGMVLIHLISLTLIIALIIAGAKMLPVGGDKFSPGMKLSMFYPYLAVYLGGILLFIENITHLFTTMFLFKER